MLSEKISEEEMTSRGILALDLYSNPYFVRKILFLVGINSHEDPEAVEMCTPNRGMISPQAHSLFWNLLDVVIPDRGLSDLMFSKDIEEKLTDFCERYNISYKKSLSLELK